MKLALRTLLLFVPALALLGATCVGEVRQKDDAGPWIGEVQNNGDAPMTNMTVGAKVTDATGHVYTAENGNNVSAGVCPFTLDPGEHGWFELFFSKSTVNAEPDPVLPLHAEFAPVASGFTDARRKLTGIDVRIVQTDVPHRRLRVEARNTTARTYADIAVCAVMFSSEGKAVEIGANLPPPPDTVQPGGTVQFDLVFNTMPARDVTYRFFPISARDLTPPASCCMP